ncbi:MAG: PP2C family protein-serine/threonine phosphatase [Melioribacteraceae bacterium]|nr:PP2C family protein-serine/threonine phosphatase [Melioribacteraceae bacterium]
MDQKRLLKTIDAIASGYYKTDEELLESVVEQLVKSSKFNVTGGRIWKLSHSKKAYKLLFQAGNVQKIPDEFLLPLKEYQIFDIIEKQRTVLADETNKTLISKGIFRYSASGVGRKIIVGRKKYYDYLLAVNSENIGEDLRYTLNIVATVLTSRLKERFLAQSRKNLIQDIDKAKELQKSILPEHEYKFHFYELFGVTIPAEIVSGDFYDYLKIGEDEERLGIVVGDAASKGLAASAEAMYISGAIRMASTFQIKITPMMNRINQLVNKIFSDDKFSSLFYAELSIDKKGLCLYANAGQNPPIFYSKKNKTFSLLEPTGPLIGPAPNSRYETDSINFKPGDVLVIYSDGIVEATNDKYEFYEENRLKKIIQSSFEKSPKEIAHTILDDVLKFGTKEPIYQDDKTLVVIKRIDE